ncbi:hypothetical protein G5714_020378 [Onychostoma macrolepis]|uniref:Uncharacterized protein n=1 Tax=Onychostoma macrolepis TaxID=369639 RepID=A0A7J6BTQ4_9TELE|nr:hypothetical protein G5714_020378 [Onychostoma macrolepis]
MESEMTEYSPFLALSPGHVQELEERYVEPVVFVNDDLQPTLEARTVVSFGCGPYDDDVLSTAASDSKNFIADSCSSLPPSGQEKRNSPSYSELLEVVTRALDKLGLDWDCEPTQNQSQSKLDDWFLTSHTPSQPRRPLPFFQDLHQEVSRETERQPPVFRSRSSSLHRHREVQRGEPSPMAPLQKDWGPRSRPPVRPRQHKRIDLNLICPATGCALGGFRSSPYVEHFLRHSVFPAFRVREKAQGSCKHGLCMMAFKAPTLGVVGRPDRVLDVVLL